MNDFTKEELQELIWLMTEIPQNCKEYASFKKVQSMIDNYCEHRWFSGGQRPWLHCIKCKENFHHE